MGLSKAIVVDKIEVHERGQVGVRTATVVSEDDVELSRSYHRHVLVPGDDLSGQDPRTTAIAQATWTDTVLADWQTFLEA